LEVGLKNPPISSRNQGSWIFCDNQSCIELTKNPIQHSRTKHIDIKFHFIREKIKDQVGFPQYLKAEDMPADILTKPLAKERHRKFIKVMGLQGKLQSGSVKTMQFSCNYSCETIGISQSLCKRV